jgi:hypothetical protein
MRLCESLACFQAGKGLLWELMDPSETALQAEAQSSSLGPGMPQATEEGLHRVIEAPIVKLALRRNVCKCWYKTVRVPVAKNVQAGIKKGHVVVYDSRALGTPETERCRAKVLKNSWRWSNGCATPPVAKRRQLQAVLRSVLVSYIGSLLF